MLLRAPSSATIRLFALPLLFASVVCIVSFSSLTPAWGQYRAFEDSAAANFTKEDHALFKSTLNEALQSPEANVTKQWDNPKTKAHGTISAHETFEKDKRKCRKARIENFAGKEHGVATFTYCEVEAGQWKVLG